MRCSESIRSEDEKYSSEYLFHATMNFRLSLYVHINVVTKLIVVCFRFKTRFVTDIKIERFKFIINETNEMKYDKSKIFDKRKSP